MKPCRRTLRAFGDNRRRAVTFARIEPLLRCFASDVLHCGAIGTSQVANLLNNMVLFEIGDATAEARPSGRQSGIDPATLAEALSNGSADSFVCATTPKTPCSSQTYRERTFSTRYVLKDLEHAPALATDAPGTRLAHQRFLPPSRPATAIATGAGDRGGCCVAGSQ